VTENPENATDNPTLDDVIEPTEQAIPDRHEHGKMPAHPNDDELARRTEHERVELGLDDYDPNEVPSATE
jgi:hypothetical protein